MTDLDLRRESLEALERLYADVERLKPEERILVWLGWDRPFPESVTAFAEYLISTEVLRAALKKEPLPESPVRKVVQVKVNGKTNVRVRTKAVDGEVVGKLLINTFAQVFEDQSPAGWYQLASGEFADKYISAELVEKVA